MINNPRTMRLLGYLFLSVIFISLLPSCSKERNDTSTLKTLVYLDSLNQLHYQGYLDKNSNELLFSLYEQAEIKPDNMIITSGGGDVLLGLEIGHWVFDNNLNIIVDKACLSSCANYIFTAAKHKGLNKHSIIYWHGSSWQKGMDELYRQGDELIIAWRKSEAQFFEKIKVDHRITTYGLSRYSFCSSLSAFFSADPIDGFDFSIEDMSKFGVKNVWEIEGEWDWRRYTKCCNVKRMKISGNNP